MYCAPLPTSSAARISRNGLGERRAIASRNTVPRTSSLRHSRCQRVCRITAVLEKEKPATKGGEDVKATAPASVGQGLEYPGLVLSKKGARAPLSSRETVFYESDTGRVDPPGSDPLVAQPFRALATGLQQVGGRMPGLVRPKTGAKAPLSSRRAEFFEDEDEYSGVPPKSPWPPKRSWVALVSDKLADTAGDVALIARRTVLPLPTRSAADDVVRDKGGRLRLLAKKPVVLVLGSGWGAHSLIKVIDTDAFEVVVVSPRNHFIFTPMLPSTAVGTVEFRSLLDPIRTANPFVSYFEASCDTLDVKRKVALCTSSVQFESGLRPEFEIPYDVAVIAVGEKPATFGVPGVEQYCYFMKEIEDCVGLRKRISECFELANLPGTSERDKARALHFVVVGGGPTGVEFSGTLCDFVQGDLRAKYPELMRYVKVSLLQSQQSILTQFAASLQSRALQTMERSGISVRTGVRVTAVTQDRVVLAGGEALEYGVCVWSTGNATRPLVRSIVDQVPEQMEASRSGNPNAVKLAVDPFLRVVGAQDCVALGDCSRMRGAPLPATAQVAGQQGAYVARMINKKYMLGVGGEEQPPPYKPKEGQEMPEGADAPAQTPLLDYYKKPFEFLSLGIMAYVGSDSALTQVEAFDSSLNLYGSFAFLLWRSVYITKQVSFRNRVLILFDWLKAKVFGRDLSQF